ncbi:putative transposase [Variovorax sp. GrIS 2.14]
MLEALRRVVQQMHYPLEVMLVCVRWYAAYPLSFRNIKEMMAERGVFVDHSTLHRWSIKVRAVLAGTFCRRKRPVGLSWRMHETYVKVSGQWKYLYRGVDRDGPTVDFLLRAKRDHAAARAFFERAMELHGVPEKITIEMRQSKYLNNLIEQDHRAVKRITRPMLGFKTFRCARILLAGIEGMHMIGKGKLGALKHPASCALYSLAF